MIFSGYDVVKLPMPLLTRVLLQPPGKGAGTKAEVLSKIETFSVTNENNLASG